MSERRAADLEAAPRSHQKPSSTYDAAMAVREAPEKGQPDPAALENPEPRPERGRSSRGVRWAAWSRPSWLTSRRWERFAILGPIALVTCQVVMNFLHLELPAALVAKHGTRPFAYHRYLSKRGAYSDIYTLYWHHHLYLHPVPYLDVRIEYPVVLGLYMTTAAALTHGIRAYFLLSSLGLYVCAVGSVCCLWSYSRRAAWIFSISPLLLVFSLLNWDLLAIFLMLLGWHAWTRNRYGLAAFWMMLGTCAKVYPVFLLLYCGVELLRRWRRREMRGALAARYWVVAVAVALAVNAPFVILARKNWEYFFVYNDKRNQYVSIIYWLHILSPSASLATANDVFGGVVAAAVLVGIYVAWRGVAPEKVAAIVFCVFLVMQKVYSPQYTLWLIPFALLAVWQFWSIVALSMVGLANYSSATINILFRWRYTRAARWYARNIEPLDRDVRLAVIVIVALAAIAVPYFERWLRKRAEAAPPAASGEAMLPAAES